MEFTRFSVADADGGQYEGDVVVYCVPQTDSGAPDCDRAIQKIIKQAVRLGDFSGKAGEQMVFYPDAGVRKAGIKARRVAVIGIGKITRENPEKEICELLRTLGGRIARLAESLKVDNLMIRLPSLQFVDTIQVAQYITEGVGLGDYRFAKYKKKDQEEKPYVGLQEVILAADASADLIKRGLSLGESAAKAACLARDMANEPANKWIPDDFARLARELAKKFALKCRVLEKKEMEQLGMGGILAVNQGSSDPARMVILEHRSRGRRQTILLVGKGVTFDSGGISLKPAAGMEDMKFDMCGGAAVLALMQAIGEEKPPVNVIAIVPATDNMSGAAAVKPGDVIRHYGGITSEIVNTDAEGRMILADALAFGIEKYKPDCVIDVATLTGAAIVGLGHHFTGLLSNNDTLVERLVESGERTGEPLWRLPMGKEYSKQIESRVADIKNAGGKAAGTITAAAYLEKFVGKTAWAHLDIAGTAWDFTEKSYIPKGPSGIAVRLLLDLIRSWRDLGNKES